MSIDFDEKIEHFFGIYVCFCIFAVLYWLYETEEADHKLR